MEKLLRDVDEWFQAGKDKILNKENCQKKPFPKGI